MPVAVDAVVVGRAVPAFVVEADLGGVETFEHRRRATTAVRDQRQRDVVQIGVELTCRPLGGERMGRMIFLDHRGDQAAVAAVHQATAQAPTAWR